MRHAMALMLVTVLFAGGAALADAPIPLHQLEGSGGVVLTEMAYLVNPAGADSENWYGMPSLSLGALIANNKNANMATISETLFDRLELSYSFHRFDIGDWSSDTGIHTTHDNIYMHVLNARVAILNEGDFDMDWLPALTAGFHYKNNIRIVPLVRDAGIVPENAGLSDDDGEEYTLTATKKISNLLPRDIYVSATARSTDAAQIGYLGFTHDRRIVFEGYLAYCLLDNLIVGAEYRQKPDAYHSIPGLVEREDDWWSLAASYIVNENWNFTVAYANLGRMLNHQEPWSVWFQLKCEL